MIAYRLTTYRVLCVRNCAFIHGDCVLMPRSLNTHCLIYVAKSHAAISVNVTRCRECHDCTTVQSIPYCGCAPLCEDSPLLHIMIAYRLTTYRVMCVRNCAFIHGDCVLMPRSLNTHCLIYVARSHAARSVNVTGCRECHDCTTVQSIPYCGCAPLCEDSPLLRIMIAYRLTTYRVLCV